MKYLAETKRLLSLLPDVCLWVGARLYVLATAHVGSALADIIRLSEP